MTNKELGEVIAYEAKAMKMITDSLNGGTVKTCKYCIKPAVVQTVDDGIPLCDIHAEEERARDKYKYGEL